MYEVFTDDGKAFLRKLYCEHKNCLKETEHLHMFHCIGQEPKFGKDKNRWYVLYQRTCIDCKFREPKNNMTTMEKLFIEEWTELKYGKNGNKRESVQNGHSKGH